MNPEGKGDRTIPILALLIIIAFLAGFALQAVLAPLNQHQEKRVFFTERAPAPIGPYSQAVQYGDFVFVSGQIGLNSTTGNLSPTVEEQTVQAMENLNAILLSSGLGFPDVVQTRIYLTDLSDFQTVNGIYQHYFEAEPPARALVQVAGLPRGAKVEIEMVAKR